MKKTTLVLAFILLSAATVFAQVKITGGVKVGGNAATAGC